MEFFKRLARDREGGTAMEYAMLSLLAGVWEGIFALLARDRDNEYLMIDSSIVRAHAQAVTRQKGGRATRLWGAPEED